VTPLNRKKKKKKKNFYGVGMLRGLDAKGGCCKKVTVLVYIYTYNAPPPPESKGG
jgi:hypothetical protein